PLVSFTPSWIFTGALEPFSACRSVLATTNSTPSRRDSIMRLTALPPPPPTPMTLIFAVFSSSSLKWMRMSFSGWPFSLKSSIIGHSSRRFVSGHDLSRADQVLVVSERASQFSPRYTFLRLKPAHEQTVASFGTTKLVPCYESHQGQKPWLTKSAFQQSRQSNSASRPLTGEQRADLRAQPAIQVQARLPRAMAVQNHSNCGREFRLQQLRRQLGDRHRIALPDGAMQDVFGDFQHAVQPRSSAGEDQARAQQIGDASLPQVVAQQLHQLAGARLQDFAEYALRHKARGTVADRGHLDLVDLRNARHDGATKHLLEAFRILQRRLQAYANIVGKVVAAHRDGARVDHHAFVVNDQVGRARADIYQANAQLALVALQDRVGTGQRLEDCVVDMNAGAVYRRNHVLRGGGAGGHDMHAYFELAAHQAGGIAHAALSVEDELLWEQVKDVAVFGQVDAARLFHGKPHVVAADFPGARAQADAAMAVYAANVRARQADDGVLDRRLRNVLGLFHRLLDGSDGLVEIGDYALAHTARVRDAVAAIAQSVVVHLGDDDAGLRATDFDDGEQVFRLASHALLVLLALPGRLRAGRMFRRRGRRRCGALSLRVRYREIGIDDYLVVIAQADRLQSRKLAAPLLHVRNVRPEPFEEIGRAQMHQDRAVRIGDGGLHIVGIGDIDIADGGRIVRAARIQFLDELRIDLHARRPHGQRIGVAHSDDHRKRIFRTLAGGQLHDYAGGIDQFDARADLDEGDGGSLGNDNLQAIGQ